MTASDAIDDTEILLEFEPYVLRNYPGVLAIEPVLKAAARRPNPKWCDEYYEAERLANVVSKRLFGITNDDTFLRQDPLAERDANERADDEWRRCMRQCPPLEGNPEDILPDWLDVWEWDVSDGNGGLLRSLYFLGRPIISATMGWRGRLPDEDMSQEEVTGMEESLRKQAAVFKASRKA